MKVTQAIRVISQLLFLVLLVSCATHPDVPVQAKATEECINVLPDYSDVTIPPNIAPLNFSVCGDSITQCVARFSFAGGSFTYGKGRKVLINEAEWREMLRQSIGTSIKVEVFTEVNGLWRQHPSFSIHVAPDSIDPYVAYRLIPPYNTYERICLRQRNIATFDEYEFYNNQMLDDPRGGHCINCHSFQNYHTDRMQFHVREEFGGTIIYDNGKLGKYNLKRPETISSGVYPAWHPSLNLVAYSVNKSFLEDHTDGLCKAEVQDSESGLILYNVSEQRVIPIAADSAMMETFPSWSPDGEWLYYAAAQFVFNEKLSSVASDHARINRQHDITERYKTVHYDIYRRHFDAETLTLGPSEPVLVVSKDSMSATLPRISPDGRYLLTCIGRHGCFHVYHPEADLFVTDLQQALPGEALPLTKANSSRAESYHNWSSNGRWIVFQSRRRDNNYTRLYFSWFDEKGASHKAIELPQQDPDYEVQNLCSYNIPEFTVEAVKTTPAELARTIYHPD